MNYKSKRITCFFLCIMILCTLFINVYAEDNIPKNVGVANQSLQLNPSLDQVKENGQILSISADTKTPVFEFKQKQPYLKQSAASHVMGISNESVLKSVYDVVYDNTTPNSATYVTLDNVVVDTVNSEEEQQWFFLKNTNAGKLTVYMQTLNNSNIDYNLFLFKLDESNMNLNLISSSTYGVNMNEQLSTIATPGYYFICVKSVLGFDTVNPFAFKAILTDKYDSSEPDDNILTSSKKSIPFTMQQTLDNEFDVDWFTVTLNAQKLVNIQLFNIPQNCSYKIDIFGPVSGTIGNGGNFTGNYTLPAGTYYFRVKSEKGFDKNNSYILKMLTGIDNPAGTLVSKDGKYIFQIDSSNNMYVNGTNVSYDWKRSFDFSYGGSYTHRSQHLWNRDDTQVQGASFGSYSCTNSGSIPRALSVSVSNLGYSYYYSHYVSGGKRTWDQIGPTVLNFPVTIIIDLDNMKVVDFASNINFYYGNKIEKMSFSAE